MDSYIEIHAPTRCLAPELALQVAPVGNPWNSRIRCGIARHRRHLRQQPDGLADGWPIASAEREPSPNELEACARIMVRWSSLGRRERLSWRRPPWIMWATTTHMIATEVLVSHRRALFTPEGRRRLAVLIVDEGWAVRQAAERSATTLAHALPCPALDWTGLDYDTPRHAAQPTPQPSRVTPTLPPPLETAQVTLRALAHLGATKALLVGGAVLVRR